MQETSLETLGLVILFHILMPLIILNIEKVDKWCNGWLFTLYVILKGGERNIEKVDKWCNGWLFTACHLIMLLGTGVCFGLFTAVVCMPFFLPPHATSLF